MKPEQLEQIKARAAKATAGPWFADGEPYNRIVWQDGSENRVCFMAHSNGLDDERDIATSDFIAHARQDIPDLIAALEAAQTLALRWQQQATSATPGGSEFCDPDYCGEYLRQNRREMAEAKLDRAALRKRIHELGEAVTI